MFKNLVKEICKELDIKYTFLSKNWITKLEKNNQVRYLSGNKFDLNGHALGNIMDDKYATYEVLNNLNIPVCHHIIFYRENNLNPFAIDCHTKEDLLTCFNKYNSNVVIKPNRGSMGLGVYHITNVNDLYEKTNLLFKDNYSISMCPFYNIKNEYRVIILDNEIKLLFKKINPVVIGDGKSTLKELLIKFNKGYYSNIDIPNVIPKKDEVYPYDFKFNLSRGSIASTDIDNNLKNEISKLALNVSKKVGITFASIDIIETNNHELLVMEINSGVTIDKVTKYIKNGRNIAKEIYKEALIKMFEKGK